VKKKETEEYPKIYLYRRIVQAKLFIDSHYAEKIDLDNISDEAYFRSSTSSDFSKRSMGSHHTNTSLM
jgi:hypothetical protein